LPQPAAAEVAARAPVATPVPAATAPGAPPAPRVALITVQPGHTLWRISREHYGEGTRYLQIYRANRAQIRNPDLIYPGQIFALPD
jgi:nucleoid-associated protein YgaU